MRRSALLIFCPDTPQEQLFPFVDSIVIGRRPPQPGDSVKRVTIRDGRVSGRHCLVSQSEDGRFFARDVSRNGTKVAGRRLVPNVEVEIQPGDEIHIGKYVLSLWVDAPETMAGDDEFDEEETRFGDESEVTVLVGDIAGYTTISQRFEAADVHAAVGRVFAALEPIVVAHNGTVKEYQGDAILAFWESDEQAPNQHAIEACRAALAMQEKVREVAADPDAWKLQDFPLCVEFALTTGPVLLTRLGGQRPTGLAMLGDVVKFAFDLEKLANDEIGTILTCEDTYVRASERFDFRDVGEHDFEAREDAEVVFALVGPKQVIGPP